jgi:hypothetical protein
MSSPSRTCLESAFLGPDVRDRGRGERERWRKREREKERVKRGHGTGGERKERIYKKNKIDTRTFSRPGRGSQP